MKDNSETRSGAEPSSDSRVPASQGSAAPSAPSHTLDARGLKKSHKNMFGSNGFSVESNTFNASSGADVIPAEAKSAFSTVNRKNTFRGRAR